MRMLSLVETQRPRQRIDGRGGRADAAPLLQPHIPVHTDASEFRHFLAPQPGVRRRPPPEGRPPYGVSRSPPRAQEIAKLAAACVRHRDPKEAANPRIIPGLDIASKAGENGPSQQRRYHASSRPESLRITPRG